MFGIEKIFVVFLEVRLGCMFGGDLFYFLFFVCFSVVEFNYENLNIEYLIIRFVIFEGEVG